MAQDGLYAGRVMENQEAILDALTDFERKANKEIPPILDQYLLQVARTGETLFPWTRLKPLFVKKLDSVMQQFNEEYPADHLPLSPNVENVKFEEMRSRIINAVSRFHGAPFTIQRLCELITDPTRHYKRSDKFLRGIEKNIMVVSTVDPFGRKVVCESRNIVNGIDVNGHTASIRTPPHTPPPPPVPSPPLWPATAMDSATIWSSSKSDTDKPDSPGYDENCDDQGVPRTTSSPPLSGPVQSTDSTNSNGTSANEDRCDKEDSSSSFDSNADDRDTVQSSASSSSSEESTLSSGDDSSQQSPTSQNGSEESIEQSAADVCTTQTESEQKQPADTAEMMQSDDDEKGEQTKMNERSTPPVSSKESGSDSNSSFSGTEMVEEDMPSFAENSAESSDANSKCDLADTTSSSSKPESVLASTNSSTVVSTSEHSQEMSEESSTSSTSSSTSESVDSPASTETPMVTCTASTTSNTTITATVTTKTTSSMEAAAKLTADAGKFPADVPCTDNSVSSTDEMPATSAESSSSSSSSKEASQAKDSKLTNSSEEEEDGSSNEASSVMETDCSESGVAKKEPKSSDSKSEPLESAASTATSSVPQLPESNTPDEEPMEL